MPKLLLIGLIVLFTAWMAEAQNAPRLSDEKDFQLKGAIVRVYAADVEVILDGTLLTPDYVLTEFYTLEEYSGDYACEVESHSTIEIMGMMPVMRAEACLLVANADHNFALLEIESWDQNSANQNYVSPAIEINEYSAIRTPLYTLVYSSSVQPLDLVAGAITAMPLVPPEADGQTLQQRHYLTDFQNVTYETLGGPIVDENGTIVGITNGINVDPNGNRQFVRVLPLTTVCRVDSDVCALIQPPAVFPPQDRTQVPTGAELIQTGEIDFKTRMTNLCKAFSMKGDLADTESGWACLRNNGAIGLELSALEIDMICQETYSEMKAFALLSGPDEELAYRWRCYRPQN